MLGMHQMHMNNLVFIKYVLKEGGTQFLKVIKGARWKGRQSRNIK
jgi:hypothetical protein